MHVLALVMLCKLLRFKSQQISNSHLKSIQRSWCVVCFHERKFGHGFYFIKNMAQQRSMEEIRSWNKLYLAPLMHCQCIKLANSFTKGQWRRANASTHSGAEGLKNSLSFFFMLTQLGWHNFCPLAITINIWTRHNLVSKCLSDR